jgi:Mg-chelatase subunit ChlD
MKISKSRWILKTSWIAVAALVGTGMNCVCLAQGGVSSMSVGMMRSGILLSPAEIKVEEFINYHRHDLPVPTDQPLGLDVKRMSYKDKHYLQIGFATPRKVDFDKAPSLNLVLVVDCSGSMSGGNRMDRVRRGLMMLMERIRPSDRLSIVTFSDTAEVRLSACRKTDPKRIQTAINSLEPTRSTNLHAGLMLGYRIAKEQFDTERSNRVILLTDGIANVGEIDPEQIAKQSKAFNKQGIDLSTIGVGQDFNHDLLRELATAGKGAVHFVDDSSDLAKVFLDEFDSLLCPSARDIKLTITGIRKHNKPVVFGYQPTKIDSGLELKLENMSAGATQVVLLKFEESLDSPLDIKVRFTDASNDKKRTLNKTADDGNTNGDEEADIGDFRKNLAIAIVAQGLLDAVKRSHEGDSFQQVHEKTLMKSLRSAQALFPQHETDADFTRVAKIAKQSRSDGMR